MEYLRDNGDPVHISQALPVHVACDRCEGMTWRPEGNQPHPWLCAFCKEDDEASQ